MKFEIYQNFKVIFIPNSQNQHIAKDITQFSFDNNTVITEKDGVKFKLLKEIYEGDLVPDVEYQIVATLPLLKEVKSKPLTVDVASVSAVEIKEFSELEGDNPLDYPFLRVIEDEKK